MAFSLRKYDPSNEADTCLWCGRKLEHLPIHQRDAYGRMVWPIKVVGYTEAGGYDLDNTFCTVGCGYQFGLAFARQGHRLQPLDKTPQTIIATETD